MKFDYLTPGEQQEKLRSRAHQLESEWFDHSLLIDQLKASGDTSEPTKAAIKASEDAQKILDSAYAEVKKKLTKKEN